MEVNLGWIKTAKHNKPTASTKPTNKTEVAKSDLTNRGQKEKQANTKKWSEYKETKPL